MKAFFLGVGVLALAAAGTFYFFTRHPFSLVQEPEVAAPAPGATRPAPKKDFKQLAARLQGDMDRIPDSLRDRRQIPTNALEIKSRLTPYLQLHEEYGMLVQVCDLIIGADQAYADHQDKCGLAPAAAGAPAPGPARTVNGPDAAVYQQRQLRWSNQRQQASSKVRQWLATLETHRI